MQLARRGSKTKLHNHHICSNINVLMLCVIAVKIDFMIIDIILNKYWGCFWLLS